MQYTPPTSPDSTRTGSSDTVEIGLFQKSVPLEFEEQVLGPERLAAADDARQQVVQQAVPDLAPRAATSEAERVRVLCAEDGPVGVVVQNTELWSPEEDDLRPGGEQHAHGAAQALRPHLGRAQGSRRPVQIPHAGAHFPPAFQEGEVGTSGGRALHLAIMS